MQHLLTRRDVARIAAGSFAAAASLSALASSPVARTVFASDATATPAGDPFASLGLQTLDLKVSANGVEGIPETLTAGRYILHLEPSGPLGEGNNQTAPGVMLVMLPSGVTMDDLAAMAATPMPGPPDWFYTTTLPGGVIGAPNEAANAVVDFTAGTWFASGPGLSTPPVGFTVTGDLPKDLPTPESNATITFKDFTIDLTDGALKSGDNILKITNEGKDPHFLDLLKGPDGVTKEQVGAIIDADMSGTPVASGPTEADFSEALSTMNQSAGTTQWVTISLEAGSYAGICWEPDPKTGVPHAMMGMYNVFTVK